MALFDVLSVGDTATDVFIRLSDAHIRIWEDDHGHWMDLPFGGKVPFEYAVTVNAGGNAANTSVGFSRLGLWVRALPARVGSDEGSSRPHHAGVAGVRGRGHAPDPVRPHPAEQWPRNFVLWFGQDRTILVRHDFFDYRWADHSARVRSPDGSI